MEANMKAGTRCECREPSNHIHDVSEWQCQAEADRTVAIPTGTYSCGRQVYKHIPLCAPCAAFHEARQEVKP